MRDGCRNFWQRVGHFNLRDSRISHIVQYHPPRPSNAADKCCVPYMNKNALKLLSPTTNRNLCHRMINFKYSTRSQFTVARIWKRKKKQIRFIVYLSFFFCVARSSVAFSSFVTIFNRNYLLRSYPIFPLPLGALILLFSSFRLFPVVLLRQIFKSFLFFTRVVVNVSRLFFSRQPTRKTRFRFCSIYTLIAAHYFFSVVRLFFFIFFYCFLFFFAIRDFARYFTDSHD